MPLGHVKLAGTRVAHQGGKLGGTRVAAPGWRVELGGTRVGPGWATRVGRPGWARVAADLAQFGAPRVKHLSVRAPTKFQENLRPYRSRQAPYERLGGPKYTQHYQPERLVTRNYYPLLATDPRHNAHPREVKNLAKDDAPRYPAFLR